MKQPSTKKGKFNAIVETTQKLNNKLLKLQKECEDLIERIEDYSNEDIDTYEYELKNLEDVLNELQNFDLIDSIPKKAKNNF